MQAIILAAGMGKRLKEYTKECTKCMVKVNGICLIDRVLDQLVKHDLTKIVIVIGYEGEKLKNHVGDTWNSVKIEYVENPIYNKTNNIYSLGLAKDYLVSDDTILLESDLIFDEGTIDLLIKSVYPNVALVAKYESWMDGTMIRMDSDRNVIGFIPKSGFDFKDISSYYKTLNIYRFSREFCSSKFVPFLRAYLSAVGYNEYYENVLNILSVINSHDLKAIPIDGLKWYEIDDKQDLDIAEVLFADEQHLLEKYYGRYGGFWRFPHLIDFCYLVNPYFSKSKLIDEIANSFKTLVSNYPSGQRVNTLLASKCWDIDEDYIVPGNGAAELIKEVLNLLDGSLGIIRPTFEEYPNRHNPDSVISFIPSNRDFRYSATDIINFFNTKKIDVLLLINPDNPSGNYLTSGEIISLAEWSKKRKIFLIVDESFLDFVDDDNCLSFLNNKLLEDYPNIIVIKSISKSYGVPGLRLGILASSNKILIDRIKGCISIWNINSFAEFFMQIYNKYENDFSNACEELKETRKEFIDKLRSIPYLRVMPSQANFVFVEVLKPYTASGIVLKLLRDNNILLSACISKKGIQANKYLRIAVRNTYDNNKLIDALKLLN